MGKHLPRHYQGVLKNSATTNQFEIHSANRWMEKNGYDGIQTNTGATITPKLFAEYSKASKLSYRFAIGVMIFQTRELGLRLTDKHGKVLE